MQRLSQLMKKIATVKNAKEYAATDEKFTFCIDLLEISAHSRYADDLVNLLEDRFDEINKRLNREEKSNREDWIKKVEQRSKMDLETLKKMIENKYGKVK